MRHCIFWLMLLCAVPAFAADPIPPIKTLADLRKVAPITLKSRWEVRIGMADGPEQLWKIVYCLAEKKGNDEPFIPIMPGYIGPVQFHVEWDDKHIEHVRQQGLSMKRDGRESLFAQLIPLAWRGECHIKLLDEDQKTILASDITVKAAPDWPWQSFAEWQHTNEAHISIVDRKPDPRCPAMYDGQSLILPKSDDLPGLLNHEQLAVKLESGQFIITSAAGEMIADPANHIMARWWINDKPLIPKRNGMEKARMQSLGSAKELRVRFGLPENLGPLRSGDKVALQLLYSPGNHHPLGPTPYGLQRLNQMQPMYIPRPSTPLLLSNKLEFTLTRDMLPH